MLHKLANCDRLSAVTDYFCTDAGKTVQDAYLNNVFKVQGSLKENLYSHGQQRRFCPAVPVAFFLFLYRVDSN